MFVSSRFVRCFHLTSEFYNSNKILLSELRKKTGYTFANCKKALDVNNNDLKKAEEWLKEQAQALGWAKASKLSGRCTLQGLIAICSDKRNAAMVEINCETDFVARNATFQKLASVVANTCFSLANEQTDFSQSIAKSHLDASYLKSLTSADGKTLADEVALVISQVGENISLRRAMCVSVLDELQIATYTHPVTQNSNTLLGKYGAMLLYTADTDKDVNEISKQLCQHIIGMKPAKIGDAKTDFPMDNKEDETVMINQEFLMEPESRVSEILNDSEIKLVDFIRYECGEEIQSPDSEKQTNENVEAILEAGG